MKELSDDQRIQTNAFVRLFFMLMLYVLFIIVRTMIILLVMFQFLSHLFTGRVMRNGVIWGEALSDWVHRLFLFLTYKTERMPFPFQNFWVDKD